MSKKKTLLSLFVFITGLFYFWLMSFDIVAQHRVMAKETATHSVKIESLFNRHALANIAVDHESFVIFLNEQPISVDFSYPQSITTHKDKTLGNLYQLPLKKGENELRIVLNHAVSKKPNIAIGQQYRFVDFLIGFVASVPLLYLIFNACLWVFDGLCKRTILLPAMTNIPLILLTTGIVLRLWYALDMGYIQFQHDYQGHIDYIKFIATDWFVPLPHKDWEFPQQPFYYIVNGLIFGLLEWLGTPETTILKVISFTTTILSCIGLVYCYRLLKLLTDRVFIQATTLGFLCFVPSVIYMSSRINNDPWAFALACIALFYIVSSYRRQWQQHFLPALTFTSLLFMTKVSALTIELLFFSLLVVSYYFRPAAVRPALLTFYLVGMLLLTYTIFRSYHPGTGILELVNSGIWPGQDLRPMDFNYFFSFNFLDLLKEGHAHIYGVDNSAVTRSFLTYQYGNMLFGEFDYGYWRSQSPYMLFNMQLSLVFTLIVPFGWLAYCFRKKTLLDWVFIMTALVAIALVLRFALTYPSVSNTDFRYYNPVFFLLAYFFASGLGGLIDRFVAVRRIIIAWLCLFFSSCITFMLLLIQT